MQESLRTPIPATSQQVVAERRCTRAEACFRILGALFPHAALVWVTGTGLVLTWDAVVGGYDPAALCRATVLIGLAGILFTMMFPYARRCPADAVCTADSAAPQQDASDAPPDEAGRQSV